MRQPSKSQNNWKRGPESGVSMVELVIVVAITMVMVALTARSMAGAIANYRLNTAGRNLAATAQLAKIKATGRDTRYRVLINTTARTFEMDRWNRTSNAWEPDPGSVPIILPQTVNFLTTAVTSPPTGQSGGPDTEMIFNSRGLLVNVVGVVATPTNSRCFYLTGASRRSLGICTTLIGKTTMYRLNGTIWEVQ